MGRIYEVLAGSLNFRDAPNGTVLVTLPRGSRLEETGAAGAPGWIGVTLLPDGSPSGFVSEQYVAPVDPVGQENAHASGDKTVTKARLLVLAPTAKAWIITDFAANFSAIAEPYGILESPRRLCHFLAQAAHESAGFRTLEEYGGEPYWSRYEGRLDLGNNCAGDGVRYHGRGIFQLTGRANYRAMGTRISLGLEDDPHLAGEGEVSLRTACEYWKARRLQTPADSNDITEVTRRINGGFNGLAERKLYFRRAWSIWGVGGEPAGV
jgi:putative chitinase